MPDTIRKQIMDAALNRLQGISVANGYRTNLGAGVGLWPAAEVTATGLPRAILFDASLSTTAEISRHLHELTVRLFIAAAPATPLDEVRNLTDDVHKALGVDIQWGGLAITTAPPSSSVDMEDEETRIITMDMTFTITYRTTEWTI